MTGSAVERHYARDGIEARIVEALRAAGRDPDALTVEDLTPFDQLHTGGLEATRRLAELARVGPADRVLDIGAGLGGPARVLAATTGCHVTTIDLTDELCRAAVALNRRVGLADRIDVHRGDALDLPFPDAAFTVAWTQHASMNIADKPRLYGEARRVLADGGRMAAFDIVAGRGGPLRFPVPWADGPASSHLAGIDELPGLLEAAGLRVTHLEERRELAESFLRRAVAGPDEGGPPPGQRLLLGDIVPRLEVVLRNLLEDRLRLVEVLAEPPPA